MSNFFKHENQCFPPSVSTDGILRSTVKSDLMDLLPVGEDHEPPDYFNAIAIDGTALVHLLPTANIKTFDDYADSVFLPHLIKQIGRCTHLDIVWDAYMEGCIKASTREKWGKGIRRKVEGKNVVPTNWIGFLWNEKI